MNQLALARKWRPHNFNEVIGQAHVVQAFTNALNNNKLHHAYLLTGTRGVGKTTLARILAKCLNCTEGVSATPCNQCDNCLEIDNGCFDDLYEIDAASRTKVEDTRDLLDNVQYATTKGRYKIYLIDEVHMLSGHSFNALLKTLEEPPEHVKFILATTTPEKLPATVLSRCLQFHLLSMTPEQISGQLENILKKEHIQYEASALTLLGKAATGSMRDALSLLDQAIAFGNNVISDQNVRQMLGTISPTYLEEIVEALNVSDASAVFAQIETLARLGINFDQALADLNDFLCQLALLQVIPGHESVFTHPEQALSLSQKIKPDDIQLYYQIGITGHRDLHLAPSNRTGFEMTLLRMLAFQNDKTTAVPIAANVKTQASKQEKTTEKPKHQENTGDPTLDWIKITEDLGLTGICKMIATNSIVKSFENNLLVLLLDNKAAPLLQDHHIKTINGCLNITLNRPIRLEIEVANTHIHSSESIDKQHRQQKQSDAENSIRQDKNVERIIQCFDAKIIENSIILKDEK